MDVSFVSVEHLIPDIEKFITLDNALVCLIKPQFEIGKMHVKNGIVKDKSLYIHILENIDEALREYNLGIEKLILSPILGGGGNREFIALIKKNDKTKINYVSFVGSV